MDHAQLLDRSLPWRTVALAATGVALAELVGLLMLAGVRIAPVGHHPSATAAPVTAPQAPVRQTARPARPTRVPSARMRPLRARSALSVLVLNGNGVAHAAGNEASRLLAHGYRHAIPADAQSHGYARSLVLFAPGYEREGRRLAHDAGIRAVSPLDGMRPAQLRGSQLVVILGGS